MLSWFLNPWMLLGSLAVASPILIHLLNKRRFKIVEWAAMDFLFEADKKNRRRVELENFILLLLRCLAMLLLALMLARPFLPTAITSLLQNTRKLERVLLVDNSLSQQVRFEARTSMETTRESIKELVARWAESDETEDWLTVFITSDPENPVLANEPVTMNTLSILNEAIDDLPSSDGAADYSTALSSVSRYTSSQREEGGRALYFYSDLRRLDWEANADSDPERAPNKLIDEVSQAIDGCFVIDTGSPNDDNLAIASLRPESLLVAGKTVPFVVKIANYGSAPAQNIRVLLQVDEAQPEYISLASLGAGETKEVTFRYVFPRTDTDEGELSDVTAMPQASPVRNYRVRAEIDRQSLTDATIAKDQLIDDSIAFYAARVSDGISVLLVDGDPSAVSERSETHYLKSLEVAGSGLNANVITATELETISLSDFEVIFLCNVDEVSADRIRSLRRWVEDGGALVLMPGNRVRAQRFNDTFYATGNGLSPLSLDTIEGDPTMSQWVNFEIDPQIHPALEVVVDSDAASLSNVDVFSWWTSKLPEDSIGKTVAVPLRLTDDRNSVAMADRSLGNGNVIVFTIPGDGDWSMWPISPTFPPVFIELIDYLVGSTAESSALAIGTTIDYQVDITAFDNRIVLRDPENEKVESVAAPIGGASDSDDSVLYQVSFDGIDRRGFYELQLTRHSGESESVLFAANVDSAEGRLRRLSSEQIDGDFFGENVSLTDPEKLAEQTVSGGNSEIWMQLLMVLFGVLMAEQFLAWYWGKKR